MQDDSIKLCNKCDEPFPATSEYFHRNASRKDGLRSECKECFNSYVRGRYKQSPERHKEYNRRYREEDVSYHKKRVRLWREANAEHVKRQMSRKQKENPDLYRMHNRNRRARRENAEGSHTANDVARIYASQGGKCAYCGVALNGVYDVDHIQPLLLGGSNWPANVCCACPHCNRSKGAKTKKQFLQFLGKDE